MGFYIKNPKNFVQKIKNLNQRFNKFKKSNYFVHYTFSGIEIKKLNKKFRKKIKLQMCCHFFYNKKE